MLGHGIQFHDRRGVEIGEVLQPGNIWDQRARPVLMKIFSAVSRRGLPSGGATSISFGPVKRAWPKTRSRCSSFRVLDGRRR